MDVSNDSGRAMACLERVFATVKLQSTFRADVEAEAARDPGGSRRGLNLLGNLDNLNLVVTLSAENRAGGRICSAGPDFGMGGPRRGVWHRWHGPPLPVDSFEADCMVLFEHRVDIHDIEDGINQMRGRDPTLHRPPRLAWGELIQALHEAGIAATESELIDLPLTIELLPDAEAEIAS
ncbi:MAG: hypothetical protein ACRDL5_08890 [Solirubrobacteraceae bacterium]